MIDIDIFCIVAYNHISFVIICLFLRLLNHLHYAENLITGVGLSANYNPPYMIIYF